MDGSIAVMRNDEAVPGPKSRVVQESSRIEMTSSEMAIVNWWIDHIATYETAASISEKSHDYTWQIAAMGEELPMSATFATRIREPTKDEMRLGKETAAKLGLP